jgi:hypothetical protein
MLEEDKPIGEEQEDGATGGITVSDEQIKLLEEQYEAIKQGINASYEAQEKSLNDAYATQESAMGQLISEAETLRGQKQELDEKAQKRERAYRYISGIGDAISGVANLVGTAHGAANQTQHYNAPEVIQKAEASRKERKLEMDKLKERLDELSAQKTALKSARELKAGELSGKKAAELAAAELQRVKGMGDIYSANAKNVTDLTRSMIEKSGGTVSAPRPPKDTSKYAIVYDDEGRAYQFDVQHNPSFEQDYRAAFDEAVKKGDVVLSPEEKAEYERARAEAQKGNPSALDTFFKLHKKRKKIVEGMTGKGANDPRWK